MYLQIFNNEVDSYQTWTLFLIFGSILILISGVVLLTHKKPEPGAKANAPIALARPRGKKASKATSSSKTDLHDDDVDSPTNDDEERVLWAVGDVSDDDDAGEDEDIDHHQHPLNQRKADGSSSKVGLSQLDMPGEEGVGLMRNLEDGADDDDVRRLALSRRRSASNSTVQDPFKDDEFGDWTSGNGKAR